MEDGIRVALLGPVEVRVEGGRATPVSGVKLQSLLAMLALAVPHVVPSDRLLDELWGDAPPMKPANALQALVSHLRRLLGRETVVRRGPGYLLALDPGQVDAIRLEQLVRDARLAAERGEHGAAADGFGDAVALVRGRPLGELPDIWFARTATARLDELVIGAHEGLIDSQLADGRHAEALDRLPDLVERHPLRERFRAQLIIALYRCGRQADALQAYRQASTYLLDELGLDPGPELQAVERSVLTHDPTLAAPIALTVNGQSRPGMPAPLTSFVGRQHELVTIAAAIARQRLTSIVGPGGVGKTRLAIEAVRRMAAEYEVWYVELAPLPHEGAVADAVASALGARERSPTDGCRPPTPEERAIARLGTREVVVVLDNCEHVTAAASRCVIALLAGCPRLRLVTTSRAPLGLEGEHQISVGPLDDETSSELFIERARAVQPLFSLEGERHNELVDLCRHLDRLPLAIELAAARAKTLPVPEIASRLQHRFQLLRRTQRAGTSHHDGLEATIAWSYDLLFEDEQRMFRRLAVFSGGADLDAIEQLCGDDAFELASRLVDRSLLVADTTGPTARFEMLESLRDYGLERLAERGELDAVRADHLRWCIGFAERVDTEARGRDHLQWLHRLDHEHDNVRAALAHAVDHDPAGALRLIGAVIPSWRAKTFAQRSGERFVRSRVEYVLGVLDDLDNTRLGQMPMTSAAV